MLPDRVSNPGPLTYESGALPIALRGPAKEWTEMDFATITKAAEDKTKCEGIVVITLGDPDLAMIWAGAETEKSSSKGLLFCK